MAAKVLEAVNSCQLSILNKEIRWDSNNHDFSFKCINAESHFLRHFLVSSKKALEILCTVAKESYIGELYKDKAGALPPAVYAKRPVSTGDPSGGHKGAYNIRIGQPRTLLFLLSRQLPLVLLTTRLRNTKMTHMKTLEVTKQKVFPPLSEQ